jgi:DNA polymerase-3 subunit delta
LSLLPAKNAALSYNNEVILTLTGENTYAITVAERQLVAAFVAKHGQNSIERVDAEELTPARLPDLLQGATLFSSARLVILKNLSANKPMFEPLTEALETVSADNTVVIADGTLDKRTKLYKFLKAKSNFKEFLALTESQLTTWLQQEAKRLQATLGAAEARHLAERAGLDQWRLAHEIVKLANYSQTITKEAIDTLVEPTPEGTAFELLDEALAGKQTGVRRLIDHLRTEEDPYKLFGLLSSQVYALAVTSSAGTRSADQIAKDTGLHPFVLRKTASVAKRLGRERIAQIASDVALCDVQMKSTGADPWDLLQLCLLKIAA